MMSLKTNKKLAVLGLASVLIVGCAATGGIDWTKVKKYGSTFLHAVALNYAGPAVASIDTLVAAFTGQKVERPDQNQYPGQYSLQDYQHPQSQYPESQYPDSQYPESQYPESQYPESQYPDSQYPGVQYPDSQFPQSQYPGEQYPEAQYPSQQYPEQQYPSQQYPEQQEHGQPSWQQWGEPFPPSSERAEIERNALSIDLALIGTVGDQYAVMPDGARLRDGVGRPEAGDRFGIEFSTTESAYVYIVNIDATGWAQTLFPYPDIPGFSNPVAPGRAVLLPNDQLYGLDDTRGIETVFVLISRTPNTNLENALAPLRGMERSTLIGTRRVQARVTVPMIGQRGLVGVVPGATAARNLQLDRYFTAPATNELAFSRWFIHE